MQIRWVVALAMLVASTVANAAEVRIVVNGVKSGDGKLLVDIYGTEAKYKANVGNAGGDYRIDVPAGNGSVTAVIANVPAGKYGATVVHDENASGKLETNFLGMPSEGVGASNDATGSFGPPSFGDMVFDVADPVTTITINLSY